MSNFHILRMANEKLNNLEEIELFNMDDNIFDTSNGGTIQFKNVKRFNITLFWEHNAPAFIPFEFHQLEDLKIESMAMLPFSNNWIEFIKRQQKLNILTVMNMRSNSQQWISIIEKASELKVIKTNWYPEHGNDGVAGVMTRKTKLEKVILFDLTEQSYNILKGIIGSEWQLETNVQEHMKKATFIRKENNF